MLDRVQAPALGTIELPDSIEEINYHFYKQGWTDGLPVIPPTAERVERMLSGMSWRAPDAVIERIPPGMGVATLRTIAVNAVMAGCLPAHLPVVVAGVGGGVGGQYGSAHRQTTTHAGGPF